MKKNIIIIIIAFYAVINFSCQDYLEMPLISSAINIDTVFSSRVNAEPFLWGTYRTIMPYALPIYGSNHFDRSIRASITDECDYSIGWSVATEINKEGYVPNKSRSWEGDYNRSYQGIRKALIFIENIDNVPDITDVEKEQMKLECKTLVAFRYLTLLRSFGGFPIVKSVIGPGDEFNIERSSFAECVNHIVELCDEAIQSPNMIDQYPTNFRGRVTRGVALAVKARTLLYAASPLYNTNNPIVSYGSPSLDSLICYPNFDNNRWKLAADANKALLDWASANGIALINTGNPYENFGTATSKHDNQEIIFANKSIGVGSGGSNGFTKYYIPNKSFATAFNKGNSILANSLPKFYKNDGTDQTWPEYDELRPFSEYQEKMHEMEPRFLATAWVYGEKPKMCPNQYSWNFVCQPGPQQGQPHGVAFLMKFCYNYQGEVYKEFPFFRLAEFYLNYAEALNEYNGNPPAEAYNALNVIRERAGLPEISQSDSRYNNQEGFRELVHRERNVELFAEDHRIFDVRRWRIAHEDGVIGGAMYSVVFTQNNSSNPTAYTDYKFVKYEDRFWSNAMYFNPFPQAEVNKGNLVQNPGY